MEEWTPARVIGANVKAARERRGMSAAALGAEVGKYLGKAWPRQTVYLVESGERAMVAAEVVTLADVLDLRVADLYAPPPGVTAVSAGALQVPAVRLAVPTGADPEVEALADVFQAVEEVRTRLHRDVMALWQIGDDARAALRGEAMPERPTGDRAKDVLAAMVMDEVDDIYQAVRARRGVPTHLQPMEDVLDLDGNADDGEG